MRGVEEAEEVHDAGGVRVGDEGVVEPGGQEHEDHAEHDQGAREGQQAVQQY